ncbi:DsbA family protein [Tomitella biformata]|uniref:DsbA family protein n=1 Tax=Tomitella biformata TaxID=630403 RepID=UPI0004BA6EEE|nr:thioredoxin domain-containing protein [Tomitella biformata]
MRTEIIVIVVLLLAAAGFGVKHYLDNREVASAAQVQDPAVPEQWQDQGGDRIGALGDQARRVDGDPLAIGAVDAPVVMVEYSDYRCPFCAKFSQATVPVLLAEYVDKGLLRIEWRDVPIFGEPSLIAARAGRAAGEQGRFWEFNTALYAQAPATGHPEFTPADLRALAQTAGVADLDQFDADAASPRYDDAIWADAREAQDLGLISTPSFAINGHPGIGAQPTDAYTDLIDHLLSLEN